MRRRTPLTAVLAIAVLLLVPAAPAFAHARLISSDPPVNGVLDAAPDTVLLTFSEPVETEFGQLQVAGPNGQRLDEAPPSADGPEVRVPIGAPTTPGIYTVAYRVISADGHPIEGSFTFELTEAAVAAAAPPEPTPTPEPTATAEPEPTQEETEAEPTEEPSDEPTPATTAEETTPEPTEVADEDAGEESGGAPLVPIAVVALLVLGVGGALLARRRDADDPDAL